MADFCAASIKPFVSMVDLSKLDIRVGMLLDIGYADGITPVLALPEKPVPDGARVG